MACERTDLGLFGVLPPPCLRIGVFPIPCLLSFSAWRFWVPSLCLFFSAAVVLCTQRLLGFRMVEVDETSAESSSADSPLPPSSPSLLTSQAEGGKRVWGGAAGVFFWS